MNINKELLGLKLEIFGLLLVLVATIWQVSFTDWFERNNQNWIAGTQETVNLAILGALQDIGLQNSDADPEMRRKLRDQIDKRVGSTYIEAINERDRRLALQHGQASIFSTIRYAMLLLGAALIVLGKWLVLGHKVASSRSSSSGEEGGPAA